MGDGLGGFIAEITAALIMPLSHPPSILRRSPADRQAFHSMTNKILFNDRTHIEKGGL